jgi:hypothetical protein
MAATIAGTTVTTTTIIITDRHTREADRMARVKITVQIMEKIRATMAISIREGNLIRHKRVSRLITTDKRVQCNQHTAQKVVDTEITPVVTVKPELGTK